MYIKIFILANLNFIRFAGFDIFLVFNLQHEQNQKLDLLEISDVRYSYYIEIS